jgi:hypothetical protein
MKVQIVCNQNSPHVDGKIFINGKETLVRWFRIEAGVDRATSIILEAYPTEGIDLEVKENASEHTPGKWLRARSPDAPNCGAPEGIPHLLSIMTQTCCLLCNSPSPSDCFDPDFPG